MLNGIRSCWIKSLVQPWKDRCNILFILTIVCLTSRKLKICVCLLCPADSTNTALSSVYHMQNKRCFIIIYPIYALPTYFISNAICIFASFLPNTNVLILVSQVSRRIILKVVGSYNIRCCSPKILCTSVRGKIIIITIILGNLNTRK